MKGHLLKILSFADFANQQSAKADQLLPPEEGRRRLRLPTGALAAAALLLLLTMLLLAVWRAYFRPDELLLASGGDGSLPAVCYCYCPGWWVRHSVVLCPGSRSSARVLQYALQRRGESRLQGVFVPVAAVPLRGAEGLLTTLPVSALVFLGDSRSRAEKRLLAQQGGSMGVAIQALPLGQGQALGWSVDYRKGAAGAMDWQYRLPAQGLSIQLAWENSGALTLQWQSPGQAIAKRTFLRSNINRIWSNRE